MQPTKFISLGELVGESTVVFRKHWNTKTVFESSILSHCKNIVKLERDKI